MSVFSVQVPQKLPVWNSSTALITMKCVYNLTNASYFGMKLSQIWARVVNPVFCRLFYTDNFFVIGNGDDWDLWLCCGLKIGMREWNKIWIYLNFIVKWFCLSFHLSGHIVSIQYLTGESWSGTQPFWFWTPWDGAMSLLFLMLLEWYLKGCKKVKTFSIFEKKT